MEEMKEIRLKPVETDLKAALLAEFGEDKIRVDLLGGFDYCRWISCNFILSVDTEDAAFLTVHCWMEKPRPILGIPEEPFLCKWFRIRAKRGTNVYDLVRPVAEFLKKYTEEHEEIFQFICS